MKSKLALAFAAGIASATTAFDGNQQTELAYAIEIGASLCRAFDGYDFYDLSKFDEYGRKGEAPSFVQSADNKDIFFYKTCQQPWKMN